MQIRFFVWYVINICQLIQKIEIKTWLLVSFELGTFQTEFVMIYHLHIYLPIIKDENKNFVNGQIRTHIYVIEFAPIL